MKNMLPLLLIATILSACQPDSDQPAVTENIIELALPVLVTASGETTPTEQDGASDPAIWIDSGDPQNSLLLGSANEGGIEIYDLDGTRLNIENTRPISLIDVHYNFSLGGRSESLVVAYDTGTAELVAYTLNSQEKTLTEVSA